jgi:xanthine dehydrogenase accessory factor
MTDTEESNWSVPHTEVMAAAGRFIEEERRGVLATVVDVEGSAYRRPGAKMILPEAGEGIGHITAGCLEDEVQRIAADVLADGTPRLERYDLMEGDDDVWGLGVGCNGIIDILLEPLDESYGPAVDAFEAGSRVAVMTVLEGDVPQGSRAYYDPEGDGVESVGAESFPTAVADALREAASTLALRGRADTVSVEVDGTEYRVFVDGVRAPPKLVVFGSGHDVGPIAELASKNGFRTTVVGFRGSVDLESRFPDADATATTTPARLRENLDIDFDDQTYVVVASHNFVDDRLAVEELLETEAPYVGLMGPHERFEEMLGAFRDEGTEFDAAQLDRVYTPIGLDLGGGEPYQIATSIVSEAMAVHNDCEPGHLRERSGHIHERVEPPEA